jgi:hypothetical protein
MKFFGVDVMVFYADTGRTDGHNEACSNCIARAPTYEFPNPQCNRLIHNTCTLFPQFLADFLIWSVCSFEKPFIHITPICALSCAVAYPGILFGGGVQQIQLRTEDRENGHLGAVGP